MDCKTYRLNTLGTYKYVVVLSVCRGRLMLSRHRKRATWETQGGHIEPGESPLEAARRELYEESGAVRYKMAPVFDYWAGDEHGGANGMVFLAHIQELGEMPESEMAQVAFFKGLPKELTYPSITPVLFERARVCRVIRGFLGI